MSSPVIADSRGKRSLNYSWLLCATLCEESGRSLPPPKAPYEMFFDDAVIALQSQSPCKPLAGFQGQSSRTRGLAVWVCQTVCTQTILFPESSLIYMWVRLAVPCLLLLARFSVSCMSLSLVPCSFGVCVVLVHYTQQSMFGRVYNGVFNYGDRLCQALQN